MRCFAPRGRVGRCWWSLATTPSGTTRAWGATDSDAWTNLTSLLMIMQISKICPSPVWDGCVLLARGRFDAFEISDSDAWHATITVESHLCCAGEIWLSSGDIRGCEGSALCRVLRALQEGLFLSPRLHQQHRGTSSNCTTMLFPKKLTMSHVSAALSGWSLRRRGGAGVCAVLRGLSLHYWLSSGVRWYSPHSFSH